MAKEKQKLRDRLKRPVDEEEGFDIITDIKEPFSFSNFFETQVLERARKFKAFMADKGILFFLTSPFQARNRLIAQIVILCIGIGFGVIPRASNLVEALQNQAYDSEIAQLSSKTVGNIVVTPAASSNYEKRHLLAFIIEGNNLPSNASKYEVHMANSYGASDWADVTYSWAVYPVTDSKRILLVAVDQSKQASGYGAFQLYVQMAGDDVPDYEKASFEITLSVAQETTDLYDKTGIHLSALTETVCGKGEIAEKQEDFKEALKEYQVVLEQAEAMPVELTVSPTVEELEAICLSNRVYGTLTDHSTTEDISEVTEIDTAPEINIDTILTSEGIKYDNEFVSELENTDDLSETDTLIFETFDHIKSAKESVIEAMNRVNTAAMNWYSILTSNKLILNQTVSIESFPYSARCTNTVDDDISYMGESESMVLDENSEMSSINTEDRIPSVVTEEPESDTRNTSEDDLSQNISNSDSADSK